MAITVAQLKILIEADDSKFRDAASRTQQRLQSLTASASPFNSAIQSIRGSISRLTGDLTGFGAAFGAISGIGLTSLVKMGAGFDALQEQARIAFTTMLGSGELAESFLKDLADFAARTPFEFPDLLTAAQRLQAMGIEATKVIPMLTAIGDAAAALGASHETIDRITLALGQMFAKGKVSAEEMRQLAEAGIPAWQILADKLGITVPEAMKKAEKGMIDGRKAVDQLVEGIEQGTKNVQAFAGMMEKQSHTFIGLFSTLKDTARQVLGEILQPAFDRVRDTMQRIVDAVPAFMTWFQGLSAEVKNGALALAGIALAAPAVVTALSLIGAAISAMLSPIGAVIAAVGALVTAYVTNLGGMRDAVNEFTAAVGRLWSEHGNEMQRITRETWGEIGEIVRDNFHRIAEVIRAGSALIEGKWGELLKHLLEATISFGESISNVFYRIFEVVMPSFIVNAMRKVRDLVTTTVREIAGIKGPEISVPATTMQVPGLPSFEVLSQYDNQLKKLTGSTKDLTAHVGGAAKKIGLDMTDALRLVNDWLRQTGQSVELNAQAFKRLPDTVRKSLIDQANAFHENQVSVSTWSGVLIAALGNTALAIRKVGDNIVIENKRIEASIDDVATRIEEDVRVGTEAMQEFGAAHADASYRAMISNQAFEDSVREMRQRTAEQFEQLSIQIPRSLNVIIDAILNKSGLLGDALMKMAVRVKGFVSDAVAVIETLPGKLGDSIRGGMRTIDQWLVFIDNAIKLIQRVFGQSQTGLAGIVEKVVGIFKKQKDAVKESIDDQIANFEDWAVKTGNAANQGAATISKAMGTIVQAIAGVGMILAGHAQGGIGGGITGALGGILAGAKIGSIIPGIGSLVGGIIGGIGGFFAGLFGGGKSELQKAQEAAQLQQAKDAIKISQEQVLQAMEQTKQSILDTVSKARDILESIRFYDSIGKPAIKAFFKDLDRFMKALAEEATKWATFAKSDIKAAAEQLGAGVDLVAKIPAVLAAISTHFQVGTAQIDVFFADMKIFFDRLSVFIEEIPAHAERALGKFGRRTGEGVAILGPLIEAIKAMADIKDVPDAAFDIVENALKTIVDRMGKLSEFFSKTFQKSVGFFAAQVGPAVDLWKGAIDAIKSMVDIPAPSAADFDNLFSTIKAGVERMILLSDQLSTEGLTRAAQIATQSIIISTALKAWAETSSAIRGYTAIAAEVWQSIIDDFKRGLDLFNLLMPMADEFLAKAILLEQKLTEAATHLSNGLRSYGTGILNASSVLQGTIGTLQGGLVAGAGGFSPESLRATTAGGTVVHNHFTIGGFSIDADDPRAGEALDAIRRLIEIIGIDMPRLARQGL